MTTAPSISTPVAGLYRVRLAKEPAPWCPLRIWQGFGLDPETRQELERGWLWRAELYEREVDVWRFWPYCAADPIPASEYQYMLALHRHATKHEPHLPEASPRQTVDYNTLTFQF